MHLRLNRLLKNFVKLALLVIMVSSSSFIHRLFSWVDLNDNATALAIMYISRHDNYNMYVCYMTNSHTCCITYVCINMLYNLCLVI